MISLLMIVDSFNNNCYVSYFTKYDTLLIFNEIDITNNDSWAFYIIADDGGKSPHVNPVAIVANRISIYRYKIREIKLFDV